MDEKKNEEREEKKHEHRELVYGRMDLLYA
jgi:hypothetical protein